jgi:hypothetical protein
MRTGADNVDVAIFTLPSLDNVKDSDAAMRVLVAAYGQHSASAAGRPTGRRCCCSMSSAAWPAAGRWPGGLVLRR